MAIGVGHRHFAGKFSLKGHTGLANVMKQRRQRSQKPDLFCCVPVVFILATQHVSGCRIGRGGPLCVETRRITHHPDQLTMIFAAYPVTGNRRIFACCLTQHFMQRLNALLSYCGLPGSIASPLGKLIQNPPGFVQCIFAALRDQQDIH